jgi:adenylylsulfate kinase-like enzyme
VKYKGDVTKNGITMDDLTPQAKIENEKAVTTQLNDEAVAPEGTRPIAVLLIGPPAAGKSSAALPEIKQRFGDKFTTVSADNSRERLSLYRGWNTPATQEEAKLVNTEVVKRAMLARHNIVFDEVGSKASKMQDKVRSITDAGYDVHLVYVSAPMHQTVPLAWDRFRKEGRYTDTSYMEKEVDYLPGDSYNTLKAMPEVKSGEHRDNTGFKNEIVERWTR